MLYAIPILAGVAVVTFFLFYASVPPEQVAKRNLGKNPSPQQIQEWLKQHGYDQPLPKQLERHGKELFTFNFGRSDTNNEVIWDRIRSGAAASGMVAGLTFTAAILVELFFALYLAYFRGTYLDAWGTFLCVLIMSITMLLYIMGGQFLLAKVLKWYPVAGWGDGAARLKFVLLPLVIGVMSGLGSGIRLYRTFFLEEMNQDYTRTARAKGVPEKMVLFRHVLKNAAIPIITTTVLAIPFLLTGSLLIESFLGIPGLGSYTVDAINSQDFAVIRAMTFLGTILYIVGQMMTDVGYALVDPRIRLE